MRNEEFGYARLTVERPMRRAWRVDDTTLAGLHAEIAAVVDKLRGQSWTTEKAARIAVGGCGLGNKQINTVTKAIAVYDAEAGPIRAKKGLRLRGRP